MLIILILLNLANCEIAMMNQNDNNQAMNFNTSLLNSFFVIFISEIADKTFILLLFFSIRTSKIKIFIVSSLSLVTMNVLAVLLGYSIPILLYRNLIDWLAVISFLIFGGYLIYKGVTMEYKTLQTRYEKYARKQQNKRMNEIQAKIDHDTELKPLTNEHEGVLEAAYQENENKILLGFFTTLMLAECGDRSQLATITLGAVYDLYGTIIGTSLAHVMCNLIAIFSGSYLARYLSEKYMNYFGGILFLYMSFDILFLKLKIIS